MSKFHVVRKDAVTATVRLWFPPISKKYGRKGTRKAWKRSHPPVSLDLSIGDHDITIITPFNLSQMILSQKHF